MTIKNGTADFPQSWTLTTLGKIREKERRSVEPARTPRQVFELYSVPVFNIGRPEVVLGKDIGSNKQIVEKDTVLVCKINPRINRVWVVGEYTDHPKIASTEWVPFKKLDGVLPTFLCYYLQTSGFRDYLAQNVSGVGGSLMRARISALDDYPFAFPLHPEQQRIVERIESLLTQLDAGVAGLKRVQAALKRYKASVLKAAVEGRLVPQDPNDEPAEFLLKRIFAKRGEKATDFPTPNGDLPELPEGWVWTSFGQVFDVYVGATPRRSKPEYWNGGIPWVSSGEVSFKRIRETRESISELGFKNSSTDLHPPGTVLLGMIGEGKTRGQAAILDIAATHNQNSAGIRVSEAGLSPEYIYYFLQGNYENTRRMGSGGDQPALNKARVQSITFPLPPIDEQYRIVKEVERRLSVVQKLEGAVSASLKRASRLRQAILQRAFEGRLVP